MPIHFFGSVRLKHQRFSLHCNYFCRVCFILRGHSYSCEFKHIKCMCFYQTVERENRRFKVKIVQSCPTLCNPMDYIVHGILQVRILEWVAFPFSRKFPNPGIEPRSSALHAASLTAEPPGKPKNTGVGSLSLLQHIFRTQELNWR